MMRTLLAGAFCVAAASAASIVEIAAAKGAPFTSLVGALKAANLVDTLAGPGPFTVFAPTDDAFKKLAAVPEGDALKNVLLSHVVSGSVLSTDLKDGQVVKTLSGAEFPVKIMDGKVMIGDATVVTADVKADNGVVHIIDTVLVPKAAPAPAGNSTSNTTASNTIVDIAVGNKNFSTLVALVTKAGLAEVLANKTANFTVLAPTNDAFAKLSAAPEGDALKNVLLSHVVAGSVLSTDLKDGQMVKTLSGAEFPVKIMDGKVMIGDATVVTADVKADNGVVHIIDTVLVPKAANSTSNTTTSNTTSNTIVDIAVGNKNFSTLVALVTKAGLAEVLANKTANFTVLAPTNDAFAKLAAAPEGDALKNVLLSHVVAGSVLSTDLKDGQMVKTLSGAEFPVKIMDGKVMIGDATVSTADVKADNGVVHIIDTVLVPKAAPTTPAAKPETVVDIAAGNKDFSTLVDLVTKAGLGEALADNEKRYTVFAPTNAAFAELEAAPEGDALKSVLLYHVVAGFKALRGNGQKFTTLNGAKVSIEEGADGKFTVNGANVLGTAKAKNGYVYIIDKVLLPPAASHSS